jgi:hypothetical protein
MLRPGNWPVGGRQIFEGLPNPNETFPAQINLTMEGELRQR